MFTKMINTKYVIYPNTCLLYHTKYFRSTNICTFAKKKNRSFTTTVTFFLSLFYLLTEQRELQQGKRLRKFRNLCTHLR